MLKYGTAVVQSHEDGTITVLEADPVIGISRELLDHLPDEHIDRDTGIVTLDTAGEYRYEFTGEIDYGAGELSSYEIHIYRLI